MTNATVDSTVAGVDGQVVTVKYKDGDKKIIIGPDADLRRYVPSTISELKSGATSRCRAPRSCPTVLCKRAASMSAADGVVP